MNLAHQYKFTIAASVVLLVSFFRNCMMDFIEIKRNIKSAVYN